MYKSEKVTKALEKVEDGIKKYGKEFLIGMIEINDETYKEILSFSKAIICEEAFVSRAELYKIISIALVNFAIKEYQNEQFWNEFASRLDLEVSDIMKVCKLCIESFCKNNGLYFHVGNKNKGYVTTILAHAIIPNSSLPKFLEFLQDIYFKDLEEDFIDDEVDELIQSMYRLFTRYFEDEDINLIVQGSKMTIARQQLPKAFRIAFVKSTGIVAPIIKRLLFYIDQVNYGHEIEYLFNDRFDKYFSQYDYSSFQLEVASTKDGFTKKNKKKFSKAQFYYKDRKLYLQIPRQIIDPEYVENEIYLEIMYGDVLLHRESMLLTKSRLFFKTEQLMVNIPKFYTEINYYIKSGNEIIYNSGEILFRDYIIFDLDGNEVKPKNLTDDDVIIITYINDEVLSDDAQIDISYFSNYRISMVFLNEESLLLINDKILSTNVASVRNQLDRKSKYVGVVVKDLNDTVYDVYAEKPCIQLRIPFGKEIGDFIISINNVNYSLDEVSTADLNTILDGSGDNLAIIAILDELLEKENPVNIKIREKGSRRIYIEENFFILQSLAYQFDKNYYYKEKTAKITNLYSDEIEFKEEFKFPLNINIRKNKTFSNWFSYKGNKFLLEIDIPMVTWRFGQINSDMISSDNIWWEDIDDYRLYIKFPNEETRLYIVSSDGYEKIEGKKIGDETRFSLDYLFQTTEKDSITLGIVIDGTEEIITEIHFKPYIKNFTISYHDDNSLLKGLFSSWTFLGKGKLYVDIIDSLTSNVIKSYEVDGHHGLIDKNIELYYGEYEVEIYQLEEDFFGTGKKKSELFRNNFIVGDPVIVKCKNKRLKGLTCTSISDKYYLGNFYLKDIRFSRKKDYYEATGMYLVRDWYNGKEREWYFTKYNPFIIKLIEYEGNRITFGIVDRDEDGLIYDTKTRYVNPREVDNDMSRYKLIDSITFEILE